MHLVNVGLHAASAALLFLALDRMTGARWRSALVAALFALHPTRVESVAWIAERKDVLSVLFGHLALLAYARYARRPTAGAYALVALAFAASLASKAMLVTLPFLLLLLDVWPLRRLGPTSRGPEPPGHGGRARVSFRRAVLEKLPLVAMAAGTSALAALAQARGGALSGLPIGERLSNAVVSLARYLGKLAWPVDLGVLYPYPFEGWPAWQLLASALLVAAVTLGAVLAVSRAPWLLVGWLWFLGTLVPVIGLVQVGAQAMADRYTYFPAIGPFVALVWSLPAPAGPRRRLGAALALAVLASLGALAWRQAGLWSDEERLYRHTLAVTGPNPRMNAVLALLLRRQGRMAEAYEHILEANRIWPGNPPDLTYLGIIAGETGHPHVAERALRAAVEAGPRHAAGAHALADLLVRTGRRAEAGDTLRRLGAAQLEAGDRDAAVETAARLAPLDPAGAAALRLRAGTLPR
jgi:hypothetical protein